LYFALRDKTRYWAAAKRLSLVDLRIHDSPSTILFDIVGGILFPPMNDFFQKKMLVCCVIAAVLRRMAINVFYLKLSGAFYWPQ
jgi:hypothetical protein